MNPFIRQSMKEIVNGNIRKMNAHLFFLTMLWALTGFPCSPVSSYREVKLALLTSKVTCQPYLITSYSNFSLYFRLFERISEEYTVMRLCN